MEAAIFIGDVPVKFSVPVNLYYKYGLLSSGIRKVRCWHSADISALPHPGIFELSFDIPYQMLLIPF
jgi:hypothetical protein